MRRRHQTSAEAGYSGIAAELGVYDDVFLSAVEHSSIFKGALHEAAAGYAPKDPFFQTLSTPERAGGVQAGPNTKDPGLRGLCRAL